MSRTKARARAIHLVETGTVEPFDRIRRGFFEAPKSVGAGSSRQGGRVAVHVC